MRDVNRFGRYQEVKSTRIRYINERDKGTKDHVLHFQLRYIRKNTLKAHKLFFACQTLI